VLEVLAPHWRFFRYDAFNYKTRESIVRRGWAEFRKMGDKEIGPVIWMARLTVEGRMLRDRVHHRLAYRLAKATGKY
jgi:hypothetical protein